MTTIAQSIKVVLAAVKEQPLKNIYLVGCGGSLAALQWGEYWLDQELALPVKSYTANEWVYAPPKGLGKNSLVITRSHSGTTPETIEAAKLAVAAQALTVAVSMDPASPLALAAAYTIPYDYGEDIQPFDSDYSVYARLIFGLLEQQTHAEKFQKVLAALPRIGEYSALNQKHFSQNAKTFGRKYKRSSLIYTVASGVYYPQAYAFTSCLLMEMLWVHSNAIHAGEYFHGPFEITDFDVPFLLLKGSGSTRFLDERAANFLARYSQAVTIIDTQEFQFPDTADECREYLASLVIGPVLRTFAQALADEKGHPLSVRRYMWKLDY